MDVPGNCALRYFFVYLCVAHFAILMKIQTKISNSNDVKYKTQIHVYDIKTHLCRSLPKNLLYKSHQIPKLKCFLYPHAVVFAQSIEARC